MCPLLNRCRVTHGAGDDAVDSQESRHETLSFAGLHRWQVSAPLPMGVGFRNQPAKGIRLLVHFPCPVLARHPVTWRRPVTKGGTTGSIAREFVIMG
jgi:hypothetical protein